MLDERGKRRPELDERNSVPIRLADGQEWLFPKPFLQIHATFAGQKATDTLPVLTYGPEIDALIAAVAGCEDNAAALCGCATLGAYMLTRQYDLSDADMDGLFAFRVGDASSWGWAQDVMRVASGYGGPRSFPAGSASR